MFKLAGRLVGVVLIVGAASGLALSILGLVAVQRTERQLTAEVLGGLDLLSDTLDATAAGLGVAQASLTTAGDTIGSVEAAVDGLAVTIEETTPVIESLAGLMGQDLPRTVRATRRSLGAAATSARAVDDALTTLSAVPLLGASRYQPRTPLHESLGEVSDSLADLPATLAEAERGLGATAANLARMGTDVAGVSDQIGQMDASLADAQEVIAQYQAVVAELQEGLAGLREGLPRAIHLLSRLISLILIWLGITQVGLLWQGVTIVRGRRNAE